MVSLKHRRALLSLRHVHSARWSAFKRGLERCGFMVAIDNPFEPKEGDIFVTWNRFPNVEATCRQFEKVGGLVLVAENSWIKPVGEKRGGMVSLCAGHHNGVGTWPIGDSERWRSFGIELSPWRTTGECVLVLPQRGYGEAGVAMSGSWLQQTLNRLPQFTKRTITVRPHPGLFRPKEPDFSKVWCAVTWASGAAVKALVAGIPVFYELKNWIGASTAKHGLRDIENPFLGDRLPTFERLAWAQWYLDEVESGEPLARFLDIKHD
jgi:hypothetical protein